MPGSASRAGQQGNESNASLEASMPAKWKLNIYCVCITSFLFAFFRCFARRLRRELQLIQQSPNSQAVQTVSCNSNRINIIPFDSICRPVTTEGELSHWVGVCRKEGATLRNITFCSPGGSWNGSCRSKMVFIPKWAYMSAHVTKEQLSPDTMCSCCAAVLAKKRVRELVPCRKNKTTKLAQHAKCRHEIGASLRNPYPCKRSRSGPVSQPGCFFKSLVTCM